MPRISKNRNKTSVEYMKRISKNIKIYREALGLSQGKLGKKIDMRISTISDLERSVSENITLENLCRIADGLGTTPEELMSKEKIKLNKGKAKELEQIIKSLKVILLSN